MSEKTTDAKSSEAQRAANRRVRRIDGRLYITLGGVEHGLDDAEAAALARSIERETAATADGSVKSYDAPPLAVGDVIECRQVRMFDDDLYRAMIVRHLEPHQFSAELLKGDFGEPGQNMMAFEISARGKTWR